jgi:hypothetical protein
MRNKSPELVSSFETDRTRAFAEIVEVTDSLKVRKLAIYVEMEAALFQALSQAWPEQKNDPGLRLLATSAWASCAWREMSGGASPMPVRWRTM